MKSLVNIFLVVLILLMSSQSSGIRETLDKKLWYQLEVKKLTMEFYNEMYIKWNLLAFRNLSRSEKKHMNCLQLLIFEVGDQNLIDLKPAGEFEHQDLQELYTNVIFLGKESENKAFIAAANLEEKNIQDIKYLQSILKNENADYYLTNLLESDKCHLNAMVCELKKRGIGYKPVLLTLKEYIDCLESTPGDINAKITDCPVEEYKCPFEKNQ